MQRPRTIRQTAVTARKRRARAKVAMRQLTPSSDVVATACAWKAAGFSIDIIAERLGHAAEEVIAVLGPYLEQADRALEAIAIEQLMHASRQGKVSATTFFLEARAGWSRGDAGDDLEPPRVLAFQMERPPERPMPDVPGLSDALNGPTAGNA